jgi:hypothetical protein
VVGAVKETWGFQKMRDYWIVLNLVSSAHEACPLSLNDQVANMSTSEYVQFYTSFPPFSLSSEQVMLSTNDPTRNLPSLF